ncbi:PREDICTED: zinc finger protein 703 [Mandrillus leucophaeus]|uniref:zinc finger protein 703 n=1 Tax=Mandrillus leucophaeus TaxID=9568 RepID=UPI0005F479E1|nr:PREDICTED: zinc finger protein 703 [Mandrillus leucophaeus]
MQQLSKMYAGTRYGPTRSRWLFRCFTWPCLQAPLSFLSPGAFSSILPPSWGLWEVPECGLAGCATAFIPIQVAAIQYRIYAALTLSRQEGTARLMGSFPTLLASVSRVVSRRRSARQSRESAILEQYALSDRPDNGSDELGLEKWCWEPGSDTSAPPLAAERMEKWAPQRPAPRGPTSPPEKRPIRNLDPGVPRLVADHVTPEGRQTCRLQRGRAESSWSCLRRVPRTVGASEARALPSEHTKGRPTVSLLPPADPLRQANRLPIRVLKMLSAHTGHLLHPEYLQPLSSTPVSPIEVSPRPLPPGAGPIPPTAARTLTQLPAPGSLSLRSPHTLGLSRYHPYGKSHLSTAGGLAVPSLPTAGPYYSPYALYGQRLASASALGYQ